MARCSAAIATVNAALGAVARGLWRAAVYLGPLLVAALGDIARLCADAVSAIRALILQLGRGKTPSQSPEYEQQEAALNEANVGRWTALRGLPAQRRFAVSQAQRSVHMDRQADGRQQVTVDSAAITGFEAGRHVHTVTWLDETSRLQTGTSGKK